MPKLGNLKLMPGLLMIDMHALLTIFVKFFKIWNPINKVWLKKELRYFEAKKWNFISMSLFNGNHCIREIIFASNITPVERAFILGIPKGIRVTVVEHGTPMECYPSLRRVDHVMAHGQRLIDVYRKNSTKKFEYTIKGRKLPQHSVLARKKSKNKNVTSITICVNNFTQINALVILLNDLCGRFKEAHLLVRGHPAFSERLNIKFRKTVSSICGFESAAERSLDNTLDHTDLVICGSSTLVIDGLSRLVPVALADLDELESEYAFKTLGVALDYREIDLDKLQEYLSRSIEAAVCFNDEFKNVI
jgi:hypothetical protein